LEVVTAVALLVACPYRLQPLRVKRRLGTVAGRAPGGAHERIGGAGFLLPGGAILTAKHVVAECKAIRATARSGAFEAASARITAIPSNPQMDLAALATRHARGRARTRGADARPLVDGAGADAPRRARLALAQDRSGTGGSGLSRRHDLDGSGGGPALASAGGQVHQPDLARRRLCRLRQ